MLYPLVATAISAIFAVRVGSDYRRRPRPYKAFWLTALTMSAIGSLAYAIAAAWASPWAFRLYYVLGALLVAPYMALGSLFLAFDARKVKYVAWAVHVLSALGTLLIFAAPVEQPALEALAGSSGSGVLGRGAWLPVMIVLNLFGVVGVCGVALYSVIRPRGGRKGQASLGNGLIALGFLLLGMAGSVARFLPYWDGAFWMVMTLGWAVAYAGYHVIANMIAGSAEATRS